MEGFINDFPVFNNFPIGFGLYFIKVSSIAFYDRLDYNTLIAVVEVTFVVEVEDTFIVVLLVAPIIGILLGILLASNLGFLLVALVTS